MTGGGSRAINFCSRLLFTPGRVDILWQADRPDLTPESDEEDTTQEGRDIRTGYHRDLRRMNRLRAFIATLSSHIESLRS